MNSDNDGKTSSGEQESVVGRRNALKGLAAAATLTATAEDSECSPEPLTNPYGGGPNSGITLPPYYRPTPSVVNANTFFPGMEELGADEMRISFIGSSPVPPTRSQAGTAIMVELGNGKRFFFDLGPGCFRNIVGLEVPMQMVNDIFITHLHVDHYGELPYIYARVHELRAPIGQRGHRTL